MAGKRPKKKKNPFTRRFLAGAGFGAMALALTVAHQFEKGDVSQTFNCESHPYHCTMDLGAGQALVFNNLLDFTMAKAFLETDLKPTYQNAVIPQDVNRALAVAAILTPYPYDYWVEKTFSESTFNTHAYNASTQARGLFQITPATALETLYYMGQSNMYPDIPETADVVRDVHKNKDGTKRFTFRVTDGVDENALLDKILYDPMKAVFVAEAHVTRYLTRMDLDGRTPNGLDAYFIHWQGPGGAQKLYDAAAKNPDQPAYKVFADSVNSKMVQENLSMFVDENGGPRSIADLFDYIQTERGIEPTVLGYLESSSRPALVTSASAPIIAKLQDRLYSAYFPEAGKAKPQSAAVQAIEKLAPAEPVVTTKSDAIGNLINTL